MQLGSHETQFEWLKTEKCKPLLKQLLTHLSLVDYKDQASDHFLQLFSVYIKDVIAFELVLNVHPLLEILTVHLVDQASQLD